MITFLNIGVAETAIVTVLGGEESFTTESLPIKKRASITQRRFDNLSAHQRVVSIRKIRKRIKGH